MIKKFVWGRVIDRFTLDFDGYVMEVTKYHPVREGTDSESIEYHSEELHASYNSMFELTLAYIAYQKLGANQHALVAGFARALKL